MSKSNRKKESTNLPQGRSVVSEIAAIESGLGLTVSLTREERATARQRSERVPDALVELLATISSQNGGTVAGMPYDAEEALGTLKYLSVSRTNIQAVRQLAQRMEDDALRKQSMLSNRTFAKYRALGRLVQTPEGETLKALYEQMQSMVKPRARRARKTAPASNATVTAPAVTTAPPPAATPATVVTGARPSPV